MLRGAPSLEWPNTQVDMDPLREMLQSGKTNETQGKLDMMGQIADTQIPAIAPLIVQVRRLNRLPTKCATHETRPTTPEPRNQSPH